MDEIKNIFGKKVVAVSQGEIQGYVLDVCFDERVKNVLGCLVIDEESEEEKFLPIKSVLAENEECILILDEGVFERNFFAQTNNPLGKKVLGIDGTELGHVTDLTLKNKKIDKIITEKAEIMQKYIYCAGKDYIIFARSVKKEKPNLVWERPLDTFALPKIEIMSQKPQKKEAITSPIKVPISSEKIINRIATENIFGLNNELLIKKGEIITKNLLEKAKKHNKLNYLLFYSK